MIKFVNRLSAFVLVGVVANGVAFAKTIKKEVTFSEPVVVNGTLVKKGPYEVVFDDQTNELTIANGRKVVAKAPAQLEKLDREHSAYETRQDGDSTRMTLVSVTLKHGEKATLVNSGGNGDSAQ